MTLLFSKVIIQCLFYLIIYSDFLFEVFILHFYQKKFPKSLSVVVKGSIFASAFGKYRGNDKEFIERFT